MYWPFKSVSYKGASFFDDMNGFKADSIDKWRIISWYLYFESSLQKSAFSQVFRLLNVDRYSFPIRITAQTLIQVAKNYKSLGTRQ